MGRKNYSWYSFEMHRLIFTETNIWFLWQLPSFYKFWAEKGLLWENWAVPVLWDHQLQAVASLDPEKKKKKRFLAWASTLIPTRHQLACTRELSPSPALPELLSTCFYATRKTSTCPWHTATLRLIWMWLYYIEFRTACEVGVVCQPFFPSHAAFTLLKTTKAAWTVPETPAHPFELCSLMLINHPSQICNLTMTSWHMVLKHKRIGWWGPWSHHDEHFITHSCLCLTTTNNKIIITNNDS